jgi:protein-S-isoprenylcysteine O-methyltransferase Ste14
VKALELKIPPVIVVIIIGVAMWLLPKGIGFESTLLKAGALVLFGLGLLIVILAVMNFRKEETTVDPTNPSKSEKLVILGVYKFSRNPMYLGFFIWLIAFGLYLGTLAILLTPLFVLYMNKFQIKPEERFLQEKFGESYLDYKMSVRRWI